MVCHHVTGRVVWAAKGRSKETVHAFFDALGDPTAALELVTADGATWITGVVAERAPEATLCLDTFHVIGWATTALDEVRRIEWNQLRRAGQARAAKEFKGLRFLLRRNWENLTSAQRNVIRDLEPETVKRLVILVPDRPNPDLLRLAKAISIRVVHRDGEGFVTARA